MTRKTDYEKLTANLTDAQFKNGVPRGLEPARDVVGATTLRKKLYEARRAAEPQRFTTTVRNKFVCAEATSFEEYIQALEGHLKMLREWKQADVKLDDQSDLGSDYAFFYTEDAKLAKRFGFTKEPN